jgi:hypothetical protein
VLRRAALGWSGLVTHDSLVVASPRSMDRSLDASNPLQNVASPC